MKPVSRRAMAETVRKILDGFQEKNLINWST